MRSKFKNFLHCTKASSAIEFAMVVPLFLAVVFSIFEVGYVFLTDLALESGLTNAARLVRTGQSISGGANAAEIAKAKSDFKSAIHDGTYGLIKLANLNVEVHEFADYDSGSNLPNLLNGSGKLKNNPTFDTGAGGSIIVVRTTYVYDIINPFGKAIQLSNYGDNQYLQVHTITFRNEPFNG